MTPAVFPPEWPNGPQGITPEGFPFEDHPKGTVDTPNLFVCSAPLSPKVEKTFFLYFFLCLVFFLCSFFLCGFFAVFFVSFSCVPFSRGSMLPAPPTACVRLTCGEMAAARKLRALLQKGELVVMPCCARPPILGSVPWHADTALSTMNSRVIVVWVCSRR